MVNGNIRETHSPARIAKSRQYLLVHAVLPADARTIAEEAYVIHRRRAVRSRLGQADTLHRVGMQERGLAPFREVPVPVQTWGLAPFLQVPVPVQTWGLPLAVFVTAFQTLQ